MLKNKEEHITKPRILILIVEYYPLFSGHAIYIRALMKKMMVSGYRFSILSGDFRRLPKTDFLDGVRINRFKYDPKDPHWEIKLSISVINFLTRNRNSFDILHYHGHLDIYGLITIFCKIFRKRIIMQMVLLGVDDPMTLIKVFRLMKLRLRVLALTDKFICLSSAIKNGCEQAGLPMSRVCRIPQGVDIERFRPSSIVEKKQLKQKLGLSGYNKIVTFIGAIIKRKGVDSLVDAWTEISKSHPEALLLLIGPCEFGDEDVNKNKLNNFVVKLREQIQKKGLNILFIGKTENVEDYLMCSNIFVLPSRKEGFGAVITEAMACGLPSVITYMYGVSKETIDHGENGYIVNNVKELGNSIKRLLCDDELAIKFGINARKKAMNEFSLEDIARQYMEIYDSLMR